MFDKSSTGAEQEKFCRGGIRSTGLYDKAGMVKRGPALDCALAGLGEKECLVLACTVLNCDYQ